jgi:hypothetical protein
MVTYSTNWMGPVNLNWYKDRDLLDESGEITERYAGGRIDVYDVTDGELFCPEYSLPPMLEEDYGAFSAWLEELQTETLWSFKKLVEHFEHYHGKKIRWAEGYKG